MTEQPMATTADGTISFNWAIDQDPSRVWKALSDEGVISRWMSCTATLEPRIGGRVRFDWDDEDANAEGTVTQLEPEKVLGYTWTGRSWPEVSEVVWQLSPTEHGSDLRLTHSALAGSEEKVRELAAGWHDFLDTLLAELGEAEPKDRHDELVKRYAT